MIFKRLLSTIFVCALLANGFPVKAMETDQYNLPKTPLADISVEVTDFAERAIDRAVGKLNQRIISLEVCLRGGSGMKGCGSKRSIEQELARLRSEDAAAKAVYKRLGAGMIPFTKVSLWLEWHDFEAQPARYRTSFGDSVHLTAPFNYLTISPTIHMHGEEFGTDKIAHIFQQGFDYYKKYRRALRKGAGEKAALQKAIRWGQMTERTYFGTWVSAIFSNADLAANYAGLKFYQGLTHDISIGGRTRPAILRLENGIWVRNKFAADEVLLKPFISRHLNEAYNPSKIFNIAGFRSVVRKKVRKHVCKQWFERDPELSKEELEATSASLETWYGEDYGFSRTKNFVTIANTCFEADD